jgi:plastocyanin
MNKFFKNYGKFFLAVMLIAITLAPVACTTTATKTSNKTTTATAMTTTAPATTIPLSVQSVTINLTAKSIAFDKGTITVPAGAQITMNFDNQDSMPHNFALYSDSNATKSIFVGQIITKSSITYKFTAPSAPGTYFFRCDVHPAVMTGTFIVQ